MDWFFWTAPIVNLSGGVPPLNGAPTDEQTTHPQPLLGWNNLVAIRT